MCISSLLAARTRLETLVRCSLRSPSLFSVWRPIRHVWAPESATAEMLAVLRGGLGRCSFAYASPSIETVNGTLGWGHAS